MVCKMRSRYVTQYSAVVCWVFYCRTSALPSRAKPSIGADTNEPRYPTNTQPKLVGSTANDQLATTMWQHLVYKARSPVADNTWSLM